MTTATLTDTTLSVRDLRVRFATPRGPLDAVRGVSFDLRPGEVLGLIADGLTNRQIGARLSLTEKTVKNYVSSLLAKLGMERRTQAAAFAARLDAEQGKHS